MPVTVNYSSVFRWKHYCVRNVGAALLRTTPTSQTVLPTSRAVLCFNLPMSVYLRVVLAR